MYSRHFFMKNAAVSVYLKCNPVRDKEQFKSSVNADNDGWVLLNAAKVFIKKKSNASNLFSRIIKFVSFANFLSFFLKISF